MTRVRATGGRGEGAGGAHGRCFDADTLRFVAGGELRWCACAGCWGQLPFWRYVELLRQRWRRAEPRGTPAGFGAYVWEALSARGPRRWLASLRDPGAVTAAAALRAAVAADGWHLAELYEIVMRGAAQNWPARDGASPDADR